MELELIELFINPDPKDGSGATAIATVDNPAINQNYFAFNSSLKKYNIQLSSNKDVFKPVDGDKQILAGALMIPEMEIYRVDDATGKEYNVKFTKDTIEQIVKKFSQLNFANNINQMHDPNKIIKDSYLYQSFIINRSMGIMPPLNQSHLPDGTWFGFVYVGDNNVWNEFIKTGIYRGFSIEGNFYERPVTSMETELSEEQCERIIRNIFPNI